MNKCRYTYIVIDIHNDRDTMIDLHMDIHAYRQTGRLKVTPTGTRRERDRHTYKHKHRDINTDRHTLR